MSEQLSYNNDLHITPQSTAAEIIPLIPKGKQLVERKLEEKVKTSMGNLESFVALNNAKLQQYRDIGEIVE